METSNIVYFLPSSPVSVISGLAGNAPAAMSSISTSATSYDGLRRTLMNLYSPPSWLEHHTGVTSFQESSADGNVDVPPLPLWVWKRPEGAAPLRQELCATDYRLAAVLRDVVRRGLQEQAPVHSSPASSLSHSSV